jgi:hypothetical protein
MVELLFSILLSACLPLLLKAFASWRVSVVLAVSVNYLVCVTVGAWFSFTAASATIISIQPWTLLSVLQGLFLAGNFYLLALTAQRAGVAVASLSSRLSVAIPVVLAIPLYGDRLSALNGLGVLGALAALILSSEFWHGNPERDHKRNAWLPAVVFFSFGLQFALLKFAQHFYLIREQHHDYLAASFCFALLVSLGALVVVRPGGGRVTWSRSVLGGLALGSCNYGALFTLTRVLSIDGWQSAIVFPTYSVGVVMISTLGAVALFAERISRPRLAGMAVGLVSVALLNL